MIEETQRPERMVGYTFRIDVSLLERLRNYAKPRHISMGYIIRRLLERYLAGEVGLDQ
jgi:hypothetical protein